MIRVSAKARTRFLLRKLGFRLLGLGLSLELELCLRLSLEFVFEIEHWLCLDLG